MSVFELLPAFCRNVIPLFSMIKQSEENYVRLFDPRIRRHSVSSKRWAQHTQRHGVVSQTHRYETHVLASGCLVISLYYSFPANYFLIPVGSVHVSEAVLSSLLLLKVQFPVAMYNFSFASVLPSS